MEVMQTSIYHFQFFISIKSILYPCDCTHIATDISASNIAFACSKLSTASKKDLFNVLGTPECKELVRLDGKPLNKALPKHLVKIATWYGWMGEDYEDIRILDFGESFVQGAEPKKLAQPGPLQAPETLLAESFDHRVDLWRAGCVVSRPTHFAQG
jgi:serine/threonine-protein kinase SRPK3